MKKMIEVEYVDIKDVKYILEDAYALTNAGHYVNVEFGKYGKNPNVDVKIMLGGWDSVRPYDYTFSFDMTNEGHDVDEMNRCKSVLINLLTTIEEDEKNETV